MISPFFFKELLSFLSFFFFVNPFIMKWTPILRLIIWFMIITARKKRKRKKTCGWKKKKKFHGTFGKFFFSLLLVFAGGCDDENTQVKFSGIYGDTYNYGNSEEKISFVPGQLFKDKFRSYMKKKKYKEKKKRFFFCIYKREKKIFGIFSIR